jgi:hypothetical protein
VGWKPPTRTTLLNVEYPWQLPIHEFMSASVMLQGAGGGQGFLPASQQDLSTRSLKGMRLAL